MPARLFGRSLSRSLKRSSHSSRRGKLDHEYQERGWAGAARQLLLWLLFLPWTLLGWMTRALCKPLAFLYQVAAKNLVHTFLVILG